MKHNFIALLGVVTTLSIGSASAAVTATPSTENRPENDIEGYSIAAPEPSDAALKGTKDLGAFVDKLADRIELHGYVQGGYDYNTQTNDNSFNFKRTVFWAKAKITDQWSFLFMHDFNAKPLEFYTDFRPFKGLGFRLGQFKNSFSLENPLSPTSVELIDCYAQSVLYLAGIGGDPLFGNHTGRDLGFLVFGDLGKSGLSYELGVMNGTGINTRDGNKSKDLIGKLTYKLIDPLSVVVSGQLGHGHAIADSPFNPYVKDGQNYRRHRFSAGASYQTAPFSLRAEYLKGWDGPVQSQGAYATATANLVRNVDAVGSVDYFDRNTEIGLHQTNYTLGVQYWFYPKCRVQLQWTYCDPTSSWKKNYNMIQLQTQIRFDTH